MGVRLTAVARRDGSAGSGCRSATPRWMPKVAASTAAVSVDCVGPWPITRRFRQMTSVACAVTSERSCVTMTCVKPRSARSASSSSQSRLSPAMSTPEDGSSRMRMSGSRWMASASSTRCSSPPESAPSRRSASGRPSPTGAAPSRRPPPPAPPDEQGPPLRPHHHQVHDGHRHAAVEDRAAAGT